MILHRSYAAGIISCILLSQTGIALAAEALVVPTSGEAFRATLDSAAEGKLRFKAAMGNRELAAERLAIWGEFRDPSTDRAVVLADGGLLVAPKVRLENEQLLATASDDRTTALPLELVAGVIVRVPADRSLFDGWLARVLSAGGETDRLLLDNGDELTGGVMGLGESAVTLEAGGEKTEIAFDKLAVVIFNPALAHKPKPSGLRWLVGLADGTRLTALEFTANRDSAKLKLAGGASLETTTNTIVCLQPLGGQTVYLSDLKPASFKHIPFLTLEWPYQNDRTVLGGQLRADGKLFAKGIGIHSPARITYELPGTFERLESLVAVDAETNSRGSVVFRVFTDDGSGKLIERFTSPVVRGGDPPLPVAVTLAGIKRVTLLVDYADRGDELDHADWLNARLVR
jgi:hypothetical protein